MDDMSAKGFFSHWIVRNLLLALLLFLAAWAGTAVLLNVVTHHNRELEVPDFAGRSLQEAAAEAAEAGIRLEVIDSVYVRRLGRGLIYRQRPAAGSKVKSGRKIRLTINAVIPKKVQMPNLVGCSTRQARAELSSRGLWLGRLRYVDDMATNNVLRQLYRGREIRPGQPVVSGAAIDLVVGLNAEDNLTCIPDVVGMKFLRAVDRIHEHSLNVGRLTFDPMVHDYADSLDAVVTGQIPPGSELPILMGAEVSLRLAGRKTGK